MPLDSGTENVMLNWTVGVYAVVGGSGRGPWMETTSLVDGDEVSRYADPGAVVIKLVRRTEISKKSKNREYKSFVVQVDRDFVLQ